MTGARDPDDPHDGAAGFPALVIMEAPEPAPEPWRLMDGAGTVSVKRAQAEWLRAAYRGWAW